MGINYDPVLIYGMYFSYKDTQVIKNLQETRDLAEEIGTDCMKHLWSDELYYIGGDCEPVLYSTSPWFDADEESCSYYIGVYLTYKNLDCIKNLNEEEASKKILNICKRYKLNPVEIKLHHDINIW